MKIINVDINDEIIFKNVLDVDTGVITGISAYVKLPTGNYNNIILNFSFANKSLCDNFNIFASFKINNGTPIVQELEPMTIGNVTYERACNIPNEVFQDKCEVTLGVYGYRLNEDESLDKRFSLVPVRNFVIEGSYDPESAEGIVPTPTVFEIYFDKINKAEEDCRAMLEQTATDVETMLNQCEADYNTFKAEKDAEVNDFLNNAEGQFMGTVNHLEAEFEETQALVSELETSVDEMEVKVDDMQTTVEKIPGDLYTQDRYNIPDVTYELMAENISIEENIFPSEWSEVTANTSYIAEDGTKLTSSGCRSETYIPTKAFDGKESSSWGQTITGSEGWLKIEFPTPQKITHMKIHTYANGTGNFTMKIQGSNDDSTWTDLYSRSSVCSSLSEINLSTSLVDFYKFYRMYWKPNDTNLFTTGVYEWQVSKYIGDFYSYVNSIDLPLTSYEKGKIVNIEGGRYQDEDETYITSFEKPYININNLGNKQINGMIRYGEKYSLVYNGESWDVAGAKTVTGKFSAEKTLQTINLGFTPDLVILYVPNNNDTKVAGGSTTNAGYDYIPRILTKAYSNTTNGTIVEGGFTYLVTASATVYYIAIKF